MLAKLLLRFAGWSIPGAGIFVAIKDFVVMALGWVVAGFRAVLDHPATLAAVAVMGLAGLIAGHHAGFVKGKGQLDQYIAENAGAQRKADSRVRSAEDARVRAEKEASDCKGLPQPKCDAPLEQPKSQPVKKRKSAT